jgi:2-succinyl-6-hydroxy-2,4-cyclohexadiene-1-carboxylate synthase
MRLSVDCLEFNVEIEGHGPPLLVLHGFTGSVSAWAEVRPALAAFARAIFVDAIGHGRSATPRDAERYTLDWSTRDLTALLDALEIDTVDTLGYSMGGRAALHFAVHAPERVRSLILESASPGIADALERTKRVESDAALADRIEQAGVEAFVAQWERQPLLQLAPHVSAAIRAEQRVQRLDNNPLGLANSLRGMGAGQQESLWPRLAQVEQPVQLIVGALDGRYLEVGERMQSLLPQANLAVVPAAGHTVHVDQPAEFVRLVESALVQPVNRDLPLKS